MCAVRNDPCAVRHRRTFRLQQIRLQFQQIVRRSGDGKCEHRGPADFAQRARCARSGAGVKTPDRWTTAKTFGVSIAPDHFLRQIRDINVSGVESADLTEADRANGFEWAGEISFKSSPCREAGDQGVLLDGMGSQTMMRQRGRWTQWVDFQPEPMRVQKQNGKWQVTQDTWFLRGGALPTPADYAKAGVK
jgi:hypothetical protein